MIFHDTDQAKIDDMPTRNTNSLASDTRNHDFVEMVWENNTLVMRRHQNSNRLEHEDSDNLNPRPDAESDKYDTNTMKMMNSRSNKRSAEEKDDMIERVVNKKGKTIIVDLSNEFVAPQVDSLVPGDLSTPMVREMTKSADHLVPGPDTSIAASNDAPPPCADSIYDDDSVYPESQPWLEGTEDRKPAKRTSKYGRNRSSLHSRFEKKRDRINKKMRALQVLLPNSNKVDKASVLDEAIGYVKSLQLQLQVLSMGTHMFTSPMMIPQIPMTNLNQFSPAMGFGMGASLCHQFPVSGMQGFPQMPCFSYMPFLGVGGPSAMAVPETTSIDKVGSAPLSVSNYSSYPNDFSQMDSELEPNYK